MSDDFFKALAGATPSFDPLGGHSDDSEWALIRKIMRAAGCEKAHEGLVLARFRSDCPSQRWPNLAWLRGVVELPVVFGRRQVPFQADALIDLSKRFTKTPCYAAWAAVADEADGEGADDPVAVAFRWPQWGDLVIHNQDGDLPTEGTYIVHHHALDRFVIEPIAGFLGRLRLPSAHSWQM